MSIDWREGSLDPKDWEKLKDIGNTILADMFDYLEHIEQEKVWKPLNDNLLKEISISVPVEPMGLEQCYKEFATRSCHTILP